MGMPYGVNGSSTTHGGSVQATQSLMFVDGDAYLRQDDGFYCPKCKTWSKLIEGDNLLIIDGKPAVLAGSLFSCGATLLPKQIRSVRGGDDAGTMTTRAIAAEKAQAKHDASHFDDRCRLFKEGTDEPAANVAYSIKRADGSMEHGVTDENGYTHLLTETANSEPIELFIKDDE